MCGCHRDTLEPLESGTLNTRTSRYSQTVAMANLADAIGQTAIDLNVTLDDF